MKFVLVTYDIVSDRVRSEVARILTGYGRRVQKSVFECVVDERALMELRSRVEREIDFTEDSVRYYTLCRRCIPGIEVAGLGTVTQDDSDWIFIV